MQCIFYVNLRTHFPVCVLLQQIMQRVVQKMMTLFSTLIVLGLPGKCSCIAMYEYTKRGLCHFLKFSSLLRFYCRKQPAISSAKIVYLHRRAAYVHLGMLHCLAIIEAYENAGFLLCCTVHIGLLLFLPFGMLFY